MSHCNYFIFREAAGNSLVASPWGDIQSRLDEKSGILLAELELDRVGAVREQLPILRNRRTDLYRLEEIG